MSKGLLVYLLFIANMLAAQKVSLDQKIGQMILIGLPTNVMDTNSVFYRDIQTGKAGGITMYERHLTTERSAENLKALIAAYQQAAPTPLFVTITQEGGIVNRLKPKYGFPPMPSAQYLGQLNNLDSTKYYSDNIAYTLSRLGINVNFAPVVDIHRPDNPVLGSRERTFSSDVGVITTHAAQVIRSHQYFKTGTVLKHFPGHGSSTQDSHLGVTDVSNTWTRIELEPFRRLIQQGLVQAVMTAHIVNTKLDDSRLPATLSGRVITSLLRKELGFDGVVFSDDMHMKAITSAYGLEEAILLAINAGVDVLLFSGNSEAVSSAGDLVQLISQLVKKGKIKEGRIEASYQRIMRYKIALGLVTHSK
jgi:beta-N-acetylhexosaminidase